MGSVAQAVLEFDEAVQAPWRPPLVDEESGGRPGRALRVVGPGPTGTPGAPRPRVGGPRPRTRTAAPCYRDGAAARGAGPAVPGRTVGQRRTVERRPGTPRRSTVRLTRRARRLVAVVVLGAGIALGSWVGAALAGSDAGLQLAGETSVVVRAGDTVWSIAASVAGDADVREVVDRIQEINELDGAPLQPGQFLRLP